MISKDTKKEDILMLVKDSCKTCGHCCKFGSGVILKEEAKKIADHLNITEKEFIEKYTEEFTKFSTKQKRFKQIRENLPHGKCTFLDGNKCQIHNVKPLYCKIGSCSAIGEDIIKWFDANYFLNLENPQSVRDYSLYCEFNKPLSGFELEKLIEQKKLNKILNYEEG